MPETDPDFFPETYERGKFRPDILAKLLREEHLFLTLKDTEETYVYNPDEGIWENNGETLVKQEATKRLEERGRVKIAYVSETIHAIKAKTYTDRKIFDRISVNLIPVANGVLNIDTLTLQQFSQDLHITSKLPVRYDPEADCPAIRKFLSEVAPEYISLLEEIPGYCIYRDFPEQKAILLVGDGCNGKSTYLNLLKTFLGAENVSFVALQDLETNRFAKAGLYRKLANIHNDLPPAALKSTGNFKQLTGGDTIRAEMKFKHPFDFVNFSKQIYAANRVPYSEDDSYAFFRRWIPIEFSQKFEGKDADKRLLKKLTAPEELSGFLNLALQGLRRVLVNGFSFDKSPEEVREIYLQASDSIAVFLKKRVEEDPDGVIEKDIVYSSYTTFCRRERLPAATYDQFCKKLRRYVEVANFRPREGEEKRTQAWRGIRFKPGEDVLSDSQRKIEENYSDHPDQAETGQTGQGENPLFSSKYRGV